LDDKIESSNFIIFRTFQLFSSFFLEKKRIQKIVND